MSKIKMKVGTKIIAGNMTVLLILVMVAAVGIFSMNEIEKKYNHVLDRRIPVTVTLFKLEGDIREQIINVRGYMLYRKEDSAKVITEKLRPEIENLKSDLEKVLTTEKGRFSCKE